MALAAGLAVLALAWRSGRVRPGRAQRRAPVAAALIVLGCAVLAVPQGTRSHLMTIFRGTGEGSATYRIDTAGATLRMAAARPLLGP